MTVGLDFGTTNSIISYWDGGKPRTYQYDESSSYTPTAIAYDSEGNVIDIGRDAIINWRNNPGEASLCRFFKTLLPYNEANAWKQQGWKSAKTPEEATVNFLDQLLFSGEGSFSKNNGPIEKLVISVPELWQKEILNPGAESLTNILEKLNFKVNQLVSEPLAAAAYYIWKRKKSVDNNILVCDMGGGTFDVSYCRVSDNTITVLAFQGNDNEKAGVAFLRSILTKKYQEHKLPIDKSSTNFQADLWELDNLFRSHSNKFEQNHSQYLRDKQKYNTQIFQLTSKSGTAFSVKAEDAYEAFKDVEAGIQMVLKNLNAEVGNKLNFEQVLFVGGFSQYFQVRKAILDYFDLDYNDQKATFLSRKDSLFAIAHGTALIAAEEIQINEYFDHEIVYLGRYIDGEDAQIPIISSKTAFKPNQPIWSKDKVMIIGNSFPLRGTIYLNGNKGKAVTFKKEVKLDFTPNEQHFYQVGIVINQANLAAFVVKDEEDRTHKFDLGTILEKGLYQKRS